MVSTLVKFKTVTNITVESLLGQMAISKKVNKKTITYMAVKSNFS